MIRTMENIRIIDHFFDPEDLKHIEEHIEKQTFKFGHSSGANESVNNPFFATYDFDEFFSVYVKDKLEHTFGHTFQINRNYGHIQTFGQDGGYHIDDASPNAVTFCLYLTPLDDDTMATAGGEFFIKVPGQTAIVGIDTRHNRGVYFPSHYEHKGMAYNRPHAERRLCITWKLQIMDAPTNTI